MPRAEATGYKIRYLLPGGGAQIEDVENVTSYTLTGLVPGQTYSIWVLAYNANGDGSYPVTMPASAMAFMAEIPTTIEGTAYFSVRTGTGARRLVCTWTPVTWSNRVSPAVLFCIFWVGGYCDCRGDYKLI